MKVDDWESDFIKVSHSQEWTKWAVVSVDILMCHSKSAYWPHFMQLLTEFIFGNSNPQLPFSEHIMYGHEIKLQ